VGDGDPAGDQQQGMDHWPDATGHSRAAPGACSRPTPSDTAGELLPRAPQRSDGLQYPRIGGRSRRMGRGSGSRARADPNASGFHNGEHAGEAIPQIADERHDAPDHCAAGMHRPSDEITPESGWASANSKCPKSLSSVRRGVAPAWAAAITAESGPPRSASTTQRTSWPSARRARITAPSQDSSARKRTGAGQGYFGPCGSVRVISSAIKSAA
jgi:hypothetical protein